MKKSDKPLSLFLLVLNFMILNSPSYANSNDLQVSVTKLKGHTSYEIEGDEDEGWKSLLEFPLNSELLEVIYKKNIKKQININLHIAKNREKGNGTMKDSDWVYSSKSGKSLYSESDTISNFFAYNIFLNTEKPLFKNEDISYTLSLGYKEQIIEFDIYGVNYPNSSSESLGKSLTYEVKYIIPYLEMGLKSSYEEIIQFESGIFISPLTYARDEDDHVLRYKLSKGDTKGSSYGVNGGLTFSPRGMLSSSIKVNYYLINTEGTQEQNFYDGKDKGIRYSDINNKIYSEQLLISWNLNYNF